ncbi:MAG: SDR family oxidoreductase [Thermoplasmatales archaeon]
MNVLLSGNKGFIGTQIWNWLESSQIPHKGFDEHEEIPADRFSIILHFGAQTLIRKSREMPYQYFLNNSDLTLRLLEKARKEDSIIVFPTSGSVMEATNPYSLSKKHGEEWVKLYGQMYGLKYYILKLFNIYGETSRKGAVYLFSKASIDHQPVVVFGDGTHKRDYTHVSDLVRFVASIVAGDVSAGQYAVGTGVGTSVLDLISIVERESGAKLVTERKEFVVPEAEDLHADAPILPNMIPVSTGVKMVLRSLRSQ